MKDWIGNKKSTYVTLGASNHSEGTRESNDFYATPDEAVIKLLEKEKFSENIWECACGKGNITEILEKNGYHTFNTDLIDRNYARQDMCLDFISERLDIKDTDIVTNPPYKYATEFVNTGCSYLTKGHKMALLLKLTFLEGQGRRAMFEKYPPERILVFSKRVTCAMNGDFEKYQESGAICYAWFIWTAENNEKKNKPIVDWI